MYFAANRPLRLLFVALLLLFPAVGAGAAADGAAAPVEALHETLLDGMKRAESLGVQGRFKLYQPAIERNFNMRTMTAIACGSYWRKAGASQRDRMVEAFTRFSTGTYANRFSGFSGESFKIVGTRPGPSATTMVDAQLVRTDGEGPVQLSYVVRKFDDGWRIVDVLLEGGISELAVKRSEFRNLLAEKGVDGLVESLAARTAAMLGKKG